LVAFYVSTGARASELLSATQGGVDPGRQLITVVRKGTRERQGRQVADRCAEHMHEPGERPEREQQHGEQPVGLEPEQALGHQPRVGSSRKMSRLTPARLRLLLVKAGRQHHPERRS
jgi:hypothetical protein